MTGGPPMERRRERKVFFWKSSPFFLPQTPPQKLFFSSPLRPALAFTGQRGSKEAVSVVLLFVESR